MGCFFEVDGKLKVQIECGVCKKTFSGPGTFQTRPSNVDKDGTVRCPSCNTVPPYKSVPGSGALDYRTL